MLKTVPDCGVSEVSDEAILALRMIVAAIVIERIEERLDGEADRASTRQNLAQAAYDIGSALEEADRWRRHYAPR